MERWDFDCQKCGKNIGDAWYVDPGWYQCSQDRKKYRLLEKAFSQHIQKDLSSVSFNSKGTIIGGTIPTGGNLLKEIKERIARGLREKTPACDIHGRTFISIDFEKKIAWWSPEDESKFSQENYHRAGLIKHTVHGRGRGRLGYCFCVDCAKKLKYKCPLCKSKLSKVAADQHLGGHWGIRGPSGRPPAPMR